MARTKDQAKKANVTMVGALVRDGKVVGKRVIRPGMRGGKGKEPSSAVNSGVRKMHRFKPGTVALRKVRKLQRSTDNLLRFAPFLRLTRSILQDLFPSIDLRVSKKCMKLTQEALENYLVHRIRKAMNVAIESRKRTTLSGNDLKIVAYCKEESMPRIGTFDYKENAHARVAGE